uniref:Cytochrome P450 1A n=1 Tax=Crocodylus porosus TaxID=8502 RepID=A0A7M4EFV4_CROPO
MSLLGSQGIFSVTEILIALAVFLLIFTVVRSFQQQIPHGLKRLPEPRGYPLIGNVLELGRNPHLSLTQMSQKYGDVMQIRIGTTPVLVLSGLNTIRQALVKQAEDFMGRPDLCSFRYIGDGQSLTFSSDSGEVWRARRKLAQNALKTFSVSPSPTASSTCLLEEHVFKEADYLITELLQQMKEKKSFDAYRYTVISVANVICGICFGRRYSHDDQELLSLVSLNNEFGDVAASGNPADFIPILQYFPSRPMKIFKDLNKRFSAFVHKIVKEHYTTFDKSHIRDITDSLIEHCQDKKIDVNANIQLPEKKIVNLVNDLFGAGFDTVTTALSWSLVYLVTYPDIQKKIQNELDQTIGRERRPKLSDRLMLPYLEAFILETFRHSSFWISYPLITPSAFNPERFLNAEGTEINRMESDKVLLFGLGKRRCIGESIGKWEIFLFLATLLQQLEFSICDGQKVDTTPQYGLTMKHKKCEHFQVKQRFPNKSFE